ncbi:MAG TPA: hypothetical protein VMO20_06355 [Candidatus Acidoferrum sp.]|nr:hypothetical protein [Candidatus Acidoferrum sp.]
MKTILSLIIGAGCVFAAHAQYFSAPPDADAFVRAAPGATNLNYGAAGALAVSGPIALNGLSVSNGSFDTFIRFNMAALPVSFNSAFGPNNWVVTHAVLQLTEQAAPANNLFNRGVGAFQVRWIAKTNWTEGTGTPAAPTMDGISYTNEATLLNSNTDEVLGTYTNSGANQTEFFYLTMPSGFINTVKAGGEVDLYLTAISPGIGFTFDSKEFITNSDWPFLAIAGEPQTGITGTSRSGKNITLNCTNGASGETYFVITSTNVTLPLGQWTPVATNRLTASGNFSITVTNGVAGSSRQFFAIQAQ